MRESFEVDLTLYLNWMMKHIYSWLLTKLLRFSIFDLTCQSNNEKIYDLKTTIWYLITREVEK